MRFSLKFSRKKRSHPRQCFANEGIYDWLFSWKNHLLGMMLLIIKKFFNQSIQFISLSPEFFSRKVLKKLYEDGAFDCEYNSYDEYEDYEFILKCLIRKINLPSLLTKRKNPCHHCCFNSSILACSVGQKDKVLILVAEVSWVLRENRMGFWYEKWSNRQAD